MTYSLLLEPQDRSSVTLGSIYQRHPGKDIEILSVTPLMSPNVEALGSFTIWPPSASVSSSCPAISV